MGLFDSVRGLVGDEESEDSDAVTPSETDAVPRLDHRDPTPMDFRNKAVDAVQEWDDCDLDYSLDSLERLDAFARKQGARLDVFREQSDDGGERVADMHTGLTIRSGSYFGEVLVRQLDGDWTENDGTWVVMVPTGEDAQEVDVFEVASHSFAEEPLFVDIVTELGAMGEDDEDDDESADETVDIRSDFRPEAEEFAAFWDEYELDFSAVSLARLDVLTDSEWDDDEFDDVEAGGGDMDSKMYTELVKQLGSYYGEVLVRELDAQWTRRSGAVVVDVPGAEETDAVTVPVFDVAEAGLTGDEAFAADFSTVAERAGHENQSVPTQAENATDEDIQVPAETAAEDTSAVTDSAAETGATGADGQPADESAPTASAADTSEAVVEEDAVESSTAASSHPGDTKREAASADTGRAADDGRADESPDATGTDTAAETEPEPTDADESKVADPADIVGLDSSDVEDAADITMDDDGADTTSGVDHDMATDDETEHPMAGESTTDAEESTDPLAAGESGASDDETGETMAEDEAFVESMIGEDEADTDDAEGIPRVDDEAATGSDEADDAPEELDLGDGGGDTDSGPTPEELRDDAEAFAATWPGHELDFSPESLARLDTLVAEEYEADDVPDVDLSSMGDAGYLAARVVEAGGYFTEVLRRRFGGEWREESGGLVFVVSGQSGEARIDPAAVATDCFRGGDSFAARYQVVCDQLSVSE